MSRNRIIYQSLALYASQNGITGAQTGSGSIAQLSRVQSFDTDFSRNFTDVNQYGQLAAIDRIEVEAPTVNLSTSWYVTDGSNEKYVGLSVPSNGSQISCVSGILKKETDESNYYLLIAEEGSDAVNYAGSISGVIGVGNCFLTSYSVEASVGDIPTASADFEALNLRVYSDADGTNPVPAVNPVNGVSVSDVFFVLPQATENDNASQPTVVRPGDITLDLQGLGGFEADDLKVQSFTLSFDLSRTPLEKLGSRFAFSREIDFPVTASLSVDAQFGELLDFNLADLLCETGTYNLTIRMKENGCSGDGPQALVYTLKGAKVVSENITTSIGDNASATIEYEVQLAGPEDLTKGIFISGSY